MKVSITKVRDEWINKPPPGFNVKFDKYPSGKDTTFVYGWEFEILCPKLSKEAGYDLMYYGGKHLDGTELYTFSCKTDLINKLVIAPKTKVKKTLTIIDWGSEQEMEGAEWTYLDKNDAVNDSQWFNQQNNFGKNKPQKPDYVKIRDLSRDWFILKNNRKDLESQLTYMSFDDIKKPRLVMDFKPMKNLQPRDKTTIQKLIKQIQFMIDFSMQKGTDITEGAKPPVVIKDRKFQGTHYDEILACGKHTTHSYITHDHGKVAELGWIEVNPVVHDLFTDVELMKAANEDNQIGDSSEPITKEDIIKELKFQCELGNEWNTAEEKTRAEELLRTDSWASIIKTMLSWEQDKNRVAKGLTPRINYKEPKRVKQVKNMAREGRKQNPDTWYNPSPYSSESLRYDTNIIKPFDVWVEDENIKNPPTKIRNYVYFSSTNAKPDFYKKNGIKDLIYRRCLKYTTLDIDFIELDEFEDDIII